MYSYNSQITLLDMSTCRPLNAIIIFHWKVPPEFHENPTISHNVPYNCTPNNPPTPPQPMHSDRDSYIVFIIVIHN